MNISIAPTPDPKTLCIYLEGKILAGHEQAFEKQFSRAMLNAEHMFIDFRALHGLDKRGVRSLLRCFNAGLRAKIRLVLLNLPYPKDPVFELTDTEEIFEILTTKYLTSPY